MKRKITADEVRRFFEGCNRQFEEAGFFLNSVRFSRTEEGKLRSVTLNYTENDMLFSCTKKTLSESAEQALQS